MMLVATTLFHRIPYTRVLSVLAFIAVTAVARDAGAEDPLVTHELVRAKPFLGLNVHQPSDLPLRLSETGVFKDCIHLAPHSSLLGYEINHAFWSDGASKRRWFAVPAEQSGVGFKKIRFTKEGVAEFPRGSVFVKHFEKYGRRLETRVLFLLSDAQVFGGSYRWRADQRDAELITTATVQRFQHDSTHEPWEWYFPSPDDCTKCHTQLAGGVLGLSADQLNRDVTACDGTSVQQLSLWRQLGLVANVSTAGAFSSEIRFPRASDSDESLEMRLRAYLHVNCGYCHRPGGAAADFDARFYNSHALSDLIGRPARINFGIDRAKLVAPNDPWRSMMLVRMKTLQPTKMPPLGHQSLDRMGIELLEQWIGSLPGPEVVPPPVVEPSGQDFSAQLLVRMSHSDPHAVIRYTLDGRAPTSSSPVYTGPLKLDASTTMRARAFRDGWTGSIAVNNTYIRN